MGEDSLNKYVVFLKEQKAQAVSAELEHEALETDPFDVNDVILKKTGADRIVWAESEEDALERGQNRWRNFSFDELKEIYTAVKARYQVAKEFAPDEFYLYQIEELYNQLRNTIKEIRQEARLEASRFTISDDDLPF